MHDRHDNVKISKENVHNGNNLIKNVWLKIIHNLKQNNKNVWFGIDEEDITQIAEKTGKLKNSLSDLKLHVR